MPRNLGIYIYTNLLDLMLVFAMQDYDKLKNTVEVITNFWGQALYYNFSYAALCVDAFSWKSDLNFKETLFEMPI